jgi:hypothetical protein
MLNQVCCLEATANRDRRKANISASELKGNTGGGKKGVYFVAEMYSSGGHKQLIVHTELTAINITVVINRK